MKDFLKVDVEISIARCRSRIAHLSAYLDCVLGFNGAIKRELFEREAISGLENDLRNATNLFIAIVQDVADDLRPSE